MRISELLKYNDCSEMLEALLAGCRKRNNASRLLNTERTGVKVLVNDLGEEWQLMCDMIFTEKQIAINNKALDNSSFSLKADHSSTVELDTYKKQYLIPCLEYTITDTALSTIEIVDIKHCYDEGFTTNIPYVELYNNLIIPGSIGNVRGSIKPKGEDLYIIYKKSTDDKINVIGSEIHIYNPMGVSVHTITNADNLIVEFPDDNKPVIEVLLSNDKYMLFGNNYVATAKDKANILHTLSEQDIIDMCKDVRGHALFKLDYDADILKKRCV